MDLTPDSFTKYAIHLLQNSSPCTPLRQPPAPKIIYLRSFDEGSSSEKENHPKSSGISKFTQQRKQISKKPVPFKALPKTHCKCLKSRCLKQYCECFAQGKPCGPECQCQGCANHHCSPTKPTQQRVQLGCNCKKTGCAKRYCECYLKGMKCTYVCNCVDCCNQDDSDASEASPPPSTWQYGQLSANLLKNTQLTDLINAAQKIQ